MVVHYFNKSNIVKGINLVSDEVVHSKKDSNFNKISTIIVEELDLLMDSSLVIKKLQQVVDKD